MSGVIVYKYFFIQTPNIFTRILIYILGNMRFFLHYLLRTILPAYNDEDQK
jgi:hypothetical protein